MCRETIHIAGRKTMRAETTFTTAMSKETFTGFRGKKRSNIREHRLMNTIFMED